MLDCKSYLQVSSRVLSCSDSSFVVSDIYKCVNVKHSLVVFRYLLMEYVLLKHDDFKREAWSADTESPSSLFHRNITEGVGMRTVVQVVS